MTNQTNIKVKYHEPVFSKNEVMNYLRLARWPRNMKHNIGWNDIKPLINEVASKPKRLHDLSYLLWTLSPEFHYSKLGLYLTDMGMKFDDKEQVKRHGVFNSEGLTNHIHLSSISKSRVAQFEIGVRAIRSWVPALKQIPGLKEAAIYLNNSQDYTLCVYSQPSKEDIKSLDGRLLNGSYLAQKSSQAFLKWAL